jgi:hypothetical protein
MQITVSDTFRHDTNEQLYTVVDYYCRNNRVVESIIRQARDLRAVGA